MRNRASSRHATTTAHWTPIRHCDAATLSAQIRVMIADTCCATEYSAAFIHPESHYFPEACAENRAESFDQRVEVGCLDLRPVVHLAVLARAARKTSRVISDYRAVRKERHQRAEAAGVHGLADL